MSFRELRNLSEMMRALGYPRPVSMENFRKPNFELVSDMLYWMVKKYDPSSSVTEEIDTEEDRVQFLTSVATEVLVKARIRLNPKKLYAADGFAVKELLKLARVLYEASRIDVPGLAGGGAPGAADDADDDDDVSVKSLLGSRVKDPKATRQLSSDITQSGAKLYELLDAELDVRDQRALALRFLDALSNNSDASPESKYLERSLKELVATAQENVELTERQCVELEAEEKALAAKIKKAQTDLERSEKRLKSLQHVRPAFMDEYEKLEKELERQYAIYCERFRNLDYLQRELDLHNAREMKMLAENDRTLKKMQKKFREDELAILRGEQEDTIDASLLDGDNNNHSGGSKAAKSNGKQAAAAGNARKGSAGGGNQKQAAAAGGAAKGGAAANGRGGGGNVAGKKPAAQRVDIDSGSDADSGSGSEDEDEDEDDETSDESGAETRRAPARAGGGGGGGGGSAAARGKAAGSDSDEVSLADSGELIDNDDESGSDGSDGGSRSGSQQSGSETNSDSDQDF